MLVRLNTKKMYFTVIFYGPEDSGKIAAMAYLYKRYWQKMNRFELDYDYQTKAKFSDWDSGSLVFKFGKWEASVNLWYSITPSAAINAGDGILFLVDSRRRLLKEAEKSWNELVDYLGE